MEQTTNKTLVRSGQDLKTISRQNVSLFCQHIFSLQQARLILASIRRRKFQITIMIFLLTDFLQKLKLGNTHGTLVTLFCVSLISVQLQRVCSPHITLPPQQLIDGNILSLA